MPHLHHDWAHACCDIRSRTLGSRLLQYPHQDWGARRYQTKIMAEVEAHQKMEREKEELNEKWDEQNAQLVDGHERLVQELTDDYEYKLQEERMHVEHLKEEKDELMRQIEETRRQVEEDADQEIVDLNKKYDAKLNHEKENNLGLKGQNGIMKKKFLGLQVGMASLCVALRVASTCCIYM